MSPVLHYWIFREPALAFGLPVFACAAILFPLHLGWTGAPLIALAGYLLIAAALFSAVDVLIQPTYYPQWLSVIPQAFLSVLALAVPAVLAFGIGAAFGPVDEALDEEVCASQGASEADTWEAESDDTFDVTPDCA